MTTIRYFVPTAAAALVFAACTSNAFIDRAYGKPVQPNNVAISGELEIKEVRWTSVSAGDSIPR
jgi:hypothetical protein